MRIFIVEMQRGTHLWKVAETGGPYSTERANLTFLGLRGPGQNISIKVTEAGLEVDNENGIIEEIVNECDHTGYFSLKGAVKHAVIDQFQREVREQSPSVMKLPKPCARLSED